MAERDRQLGVIIKQERERMAELMMKRATGGNSIWPLTAGKFCDLVLN